MEKEHHIKSNRTHYCGQKGDYFIWTLAFCVYVFFYQLTAFMALLRHMGR